MSTSALTDAIYQNTPGNSEGMPVAISSWDPGAVKETTSPPSGWTAFTGWSDTRPAVTLSEAQVDGGLTLHSYYRGHGHPTATLALTASDTVGGAPYSSAPQTITVHDPAPATSPQMTGELALLMQNIASGFQKGFDSAPGMWRPTVAATSQFESCLAHPLHP